MCLPAKMSISQTPEPMNVTLHGIKDFVCVIKLRILRRGKDPDYTGGPKRISRVLVRGKEEDSMQEAMEQRKQKFLLQH